LRLEEFKLILVFVLLIYGILLGFRSMLQFIYSGNKDFISNSKNIDLLFELFHLADKVTVAFL
jgi:hypothetical protein